jgi:hypothetical protein
MNTRLLIPLVIAALATIISPTWAHSAIIMPTNGSATLLITALSLSLSLCLRGFVTGETFRLQSLSQSSIVQTPPSANESELQEKESPHFYLSFSPALVGVLGVQSGNGLNISHCSYICL